jgi:hypothetical protein
MVVTINNVIESCVRGNSTLYSIHSFVDTWSALLRWTGDVFGAKQGGVHVRRAFFLQCIFVSSCAFFSFNALT